LLADTELTPADYLALPLFEPAVAAVEGEKPARSYYQMDYDPGDVQGLIFFGQRALGRSPTASEKWAVPALLALLLPLGLGCKVVVSDSPLPLFASGEDFKETVVFDGPHP